jgi:hypothetical protein
VISVPQLSPECFRYYVRLGEFTLQIAEAAGHFNGLTFELSVPPLALRLSERLDIAG